MCHGAGPACSAAMWLSLSHSLHFKATSQFFASSRRATPKADALLFKKSLTLLERLILHKPLHFLRGCFFFMNGALSIDITQLAARTV